MSITSIKDKVSARVAAGAVGVAMIVSLGLGVATQAYAAGLTSSQVQSILSLLQSFGADQATINNVQAALTGQPTTGGSSSSTGGSTASTCYSFTRDLTMGSTGADVMALQQFLNANGAQVAASGAGSPGHESSYFGGLTRAALAKFQAAHAISPAAGYFGPLTRASVSTMCGSTGSNGGGTVTPTGPGITVSAATQPTMSLAPRNASRVPFTNFTLTNNTSAPVTVNSIAVQRAGLGADTDFAGVVLLDQNGVQLGNSQTFNSNHQANLGNNFTLAAGQSETFTVAGNIAAVPGAGNVDAIQVTGVNTSVPVSGSFPITGAGQTINIALSLGTATAINSGFDPNASRNESIGTAGLTFSAVHLTANTEDQKLMSITWNQTGSVGSTDLSNLRTVVNGTSYPVTVDASGKYYTSVFPGGVLIPKGNSADVYIQGDITGSNAANRTVEFDIYRASDIYLVGQTYGYGITPTATGSGTYTAGNNSTSGFQATTNPFYFGATVTVTGGTLSTISTASNVAPQNIAVNVSNQVLGGFQTNFTGEPVTVQSLKLHVASTTGASQLQNVTLVDQNGNVVAGPDDSVYASANTSTVTFNSSITFPTGPMTYTVKGTVASVGAANGGTYTLSTNPSTDWSSAVGQTSGTYLTLTNTTITMSTMTIQSGSLTVSAAASPAATTLSLNQSNYTIANIVLDASQSGEDVRLNALPIVVHASSTYGANELKSNLTNCQLYNGGSVLNTQSVGSNEWATQTGLDATPLSVDGVEANFTFANSLVVPKGTSVTLALKCNVGGSLHNTDQFAAGVDSHFKPTITGATSGNSLTPTVSAGSTSGTMTIGTASMTTSVPTPLSYTQVAGGTTGVTVGTFTLQPNSGDVSLQHVGLKLNSNFASTSDLVNGAVAIMNGTTQIGTVNFSGKTPTSGFYYATSTISGVSLPQNVQTTLTLKADIAPVGVGQSGTSGHEIRVGLSDADGTSGSSLVNSGAATQPTTGVALFASEPSVAQVSLGNGASDGKLVAFSISADSKHSLGIGKLSFTITPGANVEVTNPTLYAYTDSSLSQAAGGTNNGVITGIDLGSTTGTAISTSTKMSSPFQIGAGQTVYFVLKASSVTYSGTNATWNVTTSLNGDSSDLAPVMKTVSGLSSSKFVWSPNSTTTSKTTNVDWANGFGVSGLPSFGISQSRSN